MASVTAGALISAGLRRAGKVDSPTGFIQHPASGGGEAFDYLNAALSELFDILYEAEESAFDSNKPTWSTVANTADYALSTIAGTTFYHLTGVDFLIGSVWTSLDRVNLANRNDYPLTGTPKGYALEGDNLTIYPTPNAIYSMRIRYEAEPPTASADVTTINLKGPWREFVELHFCVQCLEKAEEDSTSQKMRLYGPSMDGNGGLAQRIRAAAKKRDAAQPTRPVDVMGDDGGAESLPPFAVWTR